MSFFDIRGPTRSTPPFSYQPFPAPGCEWIWDHQKLPFLPCGKVPGEFPSANGDQVGCDFFVPGLIDREMPEKKTCPLKINGWTDVFPIEVVLF